MARVEVGSPWFEDLAVGQSFTDSPSVTLTEGHAAVQAAITGERLRLPLDEVLSEEVTGHPTALASPMLVSNMAIGQSTPPTGRVLGNLFYRGLAFSRPVFIGDTIHTTTRVVGLKQNQPKPGRPATGLAALEVDVADQSGATVLHFWRCPMLPCRDPEAETGHNDSFDNIPSELDIEAVKEAVPADWRLDLFRERSGGEHYGELEQGRVYSVQGRDTVTAAPELVRMTLNVASAHLDARASSYEQRLVYGGHAISMAAAQMTRALPNLVNILAWRGCEHTAPVFEGDILRSEVEVEAKYPLAGQGGLAGLHVVVHAERGPDEIKVLDWRPICLMA